jgi:predicted PurR-regulated permease PerM
LWAKFGGNMAEGVPIITAGGPERHQRSEFVHRVAIVLFMVVGVAALIFVFVRATDIFLMVFAGALFAIFLRSLARYVHRWTGIRHRWAVLLVLLFLVVVAAAAGWLLAGPIADQFHQLGQQVPSAVAQLQQKFHESRVGQFILQRTNTAQIQPGAVTAHIGDVLSITMAGIVGLLVILFCGIFLAIDPELYVGGFLRLFPREKRPRTRAILDQLGTNLQNWIFGQVISMTIVGLMTWVGLHFVGVPLAGALGVITGVLDFIPVVGPFIAATIAVLLAVVKEPMLAVWTILVFVIMQQIEGHIIIPQVQKYASNLPPVLTIVGLALFSNLFGFMGLLLAVPLLVVCLILVRTLYQEDVLKNSGAD